MSEHAKHLVPAGDGTFVVVLESDCLECAEVAVSRALLTIAGPDWIPGRSWRVVHADGRRYDDGRVQVWCETSNEEEARAALASCPGGGVLQRLFERSESEWRPVR